MQYAVIERNFYEAFMKKNLMLCLFLGSNIAYDSSINLRNILWLAPLPNKLTKAWDAPG